MNKHKKTKRLVAVIPDKLHRKASAKAALEGRSLKDVVQELLEEWTKQSDVEKPELEISLVA